MIWEESKGERKLACEKEEDVAGSGREEGDLEEEETRSTPVGCYSGFYCRRIIETSSPPTQEDEKLQPTGAGAAGSLL